MSTDTHAEEKYIGFIESLDGKIFKNINGEQIELNEFDQIFTNQEIIISSNATISFLDNSILSLEKGSRFIVKEFDNLLQNPKFIISIEEGRFTFESGTIAKNKNGIMKINLSEMEVALNGTLISGLNSTETKQVALIEDSMGRVGTLNITIGDQTTTVSNPSTGISLSGNNEIQQTNLSQEEASQIKKFIKEATIEASTETEQDINRAVAKQLAAGTIPDANGDGITDANDLDLYKEQLFEFKGNRMGYYMEMSNGNDFGLMSDMIRYSDPSQSMQIMQGMMEYDPANAEMMMKEVSKEGFDIFSHISNASNETGTMIYKGGPSNFEDVRTSIVDGMMQNQSEDSAETMAMMMAVGDPTMNSYLVNEITNYGGVDPDNNLSMNVLASFTEMAPNKMDAYMQADPSIMGNFTQSAFQNADEGDAGMIADMMQQSSGKNSAYLMSSMMENNDLMITSVYGNLAEQNFDIFNHIETAKIDPFANPGTNSLIPGTDPANMEAGQNDFYDSLKGQIFNEIISNSDQTAADATAGLMMNSQGDSAVFMMETMMDTNPEIIGDVMQGFVQDDFDIFNHFESTGTNNLDDGAAAIALTDANPDMQNFKAEVFKDMMTYSNDDTMETMAQLVAKADTETAALIFETVVSEQNNMMVDDSFIPVTNYALDLMDNLSNVDPSIVDTMYENQGDLVNDMMSTAMTNVSANDSEAIANIISSSSNESFNEAVFTDMASQNDSTLTNNVFTSVAESAPETLVAIASTNTALYNNIVSDVSITGMTAASLMTDIYNTTGYAYTDPATGTTTTTAATYTATGTTTTGSNTGFEPTWSMTPSSGTYSLSDYIAIYASAMSTNGVTYSATGLPPGLTFDYTSGSIFGTPTTSGSYTVSLSAYDIMNTSYYSTQTFNLTITGSGSGAGKSSISDPTFSMYPSAYGTYSTNSPINIYSMAESSPPANGVTYSMLNFPTGLVISKSGEISGSPKTSGTYNVAVTATDKLNTTYQKTVYFSLTISDGGGGGGAGPAWMSTAADFSSLTLTKDSPISQITLNAMGDGVTYTGDANLSTLGLSVSAAGIISGTPSTTTATETTVVFTATDSTGSSNFTVNFPIVNTGGGGGGGVTWTTTATEFSSLTLTEGSPMSSITLSATGIGTISYADNAMLPAGISLTAGIVSGTPTSSAATSTSVTFTATDGNGDTEDLVVSFPAINASGGGSNVTWNATISGVPATLTENSTISSFDLSNSVNDEPATVTYSVSSGSLPAGLDLFGSTVSGTPSTPSAATTVTFKVAETGSATNFAFRNVIFPAVDASGGGSNVTWNATISGVPATLTENSTISSFDLSNSVNDEPATVTYSVSSGSLPAGLDLFGSTVSGTPSTPSAATTVTFKVAETGSATNFAFRNVIFPAVDASGGGSNVTWNATISGVPATLTENSTISSFDLSNSVNDEPATVTYSVSSGSLPAGLDLFGSTVSGTPSTPSAATTVTFKVAETGSATNFAFRNVIFPAVDASGGGATVTFTTPAGSLSGVAQSAGQSINETVQATASNGGSITFNFVTTNNINGITGLPGSMNISNNVISGIAPSLLRAATYTFAVTAEVSGGTPNNRSFTLDILADATCTSPTNNICT